MTHIADSAVAIDLYIWEGASDIFPRVEQALAGYDVTLWRMGGTDTPSPDLDRSRVALALVSASVVGDTRYIGQDWLAAQALPVVWVAAEARGQDPRFYPPAYAHTLPAGFTGAELRAAMGRLLRAARTAVPAAPAEQRPLVAHSEVMQALLAEVDLFADSRSHVLVFGETGVGKERIAQRLHARAPWQAGPFVAVNCGAVPEGLFEAHFFGHAKGAFTGAVGAHKGYFEQAQGGTLFLDEIGDLPLYQQVKLLRVLEDGRVTRLGTTQDIAVDFRLVTATNKDLPALVAQGAFRADLYYRLAVIELWVPNLEARGTAEKIALFCALLAQHLPSDLPDSAPPAWLLERVAQTSYPGNVRELSNVCERIGLIRKQVGHWDVMRIERVFDRLAGLHAGQAVSPLPVGQPVAPVPALGQADRAERARVLAALEANGWRRQDTAQQLGISRKVLWEKMRKFQLGSHNDTSMLV